MSAYELASIERPRGERLQVLWSESNGFHSVTLSVIHGPGAARGPSITLRLSELWNALDGLTKATGLAMRVRR